MTIDDAQWMARLIGQLTEPQIVQALIGSGYDSAHVRLYAAKLIRRRDQMVMDLLPELVEDGVPTAGARGRADLMEALGE